mgnify:CR=1 FL=1
MNNGITVSEKDELIMRLVHYFVTKENYAPIMVNGVKNEIWLENLDATYKVVRINSNYIHNSEQFDFDMYKILNVNKQIGKKTLTRKLKTLNIFTDINEDVLVKNSKNITNFIIMSDDDLNNKDGIISLYPQIYEEEIKDLHGLDFLLNVSTDINKKTEDDNKFYESVFSEKKIVFTNLLIILNVIISLVVLFLYYSNTYDLFSILAVNSNAIKNGEVWRLVTGGFLHVDIIHLMCNMYSLYVIGTQIESFIGKKKFILVYFISMIVGNMLSVVLSNGLSVGASGAIFGLLGSLIYFGYHYRLYLGSVMKSQIIPLLILNLGIGFIVPNINVVAHIGGLVGGIFATMALGIEKKTNRSERINGFISLAVLIIFLCIMIFK